MDRPVGARSDERRRGGRGDRDEAGEERGALRADPLHAHVPAHEADDRDDHRLPQQRGGLGAVGTSQPRGPVEDQPGRRRLDRGETAHGGRQQSRSQGPQYGNREHREAHLTRKCTPGEGDSNAVRTAPPLDRERADRDERRPVEHDPARTASLQEGDENRDGHGSAADEDSGDCGFGAAFGGDDGKVEADHADSREQGETGPLACRERAQPGLLVLAGEREEQQAGEAVAQELAARVRVVAQDAVRAEGRADEDAGEGGERGAAGGGGGHGSDARESGGPD